MTAFVAIGLTFGSCLALCWLRLVAHGQNRDARIFGICALVCFGSVAFTFGTYISTELFG